MRKRTGKYLLLSYPHKNDEQAARIIEVLQEAEYRVWFDEGLEFGAMYNQVIVEHRDHTGFHGKTPRDQKAVPSRNGEVPEWSERVHDGREG